MSKEPDPSVEERSWRALISGSRRDLQRIYQFQPCRLDFAMRGGTPELSIRLEDLPGGLDDPVSDEARRRVGAAIESVVDNLNAIGKLRWGRAFDGVSAGALVSVDSSGARRDATIFAKSIAAYVTFEEGKCFLERQGIDPTSMPEALPDIRSLDLRAANRLASTEPAVARALRLLDLALRDDEHRIDWRVAYAALEVVENDAKERGLDGQALGWWTRSRRRAFNATANSPEALGLRARHQTPRPGGPRMSEEEADYFVRGVLARWMNHLAS